ncbi:TPA: hypothetical protein QIB60_000497 [Enterobacter cloacae subsp. dissolvens]|nr:hypothetical protein [Enterobacter cloacae subsp. dissolvens]
MTNNKPKVRTTTGATVTLTVQISNVGSWGPDCQIEQVYRQALIEAKGRIAKALEGKDIRFIGEPIVRAITTDMELKK